MECSTKATLDDVVVDVNIDEDKVVVKLMEGCLILDWNEAKKIARAVISQEREELPYFRGV